MELLTKFALGDTVYVLKKSKAVKMEIRCIAIDETGDYYSDCRVPYIGRPYPAKECFASIDELVKYITSE